MSELGPTKLATIMSVDVAGYSALAEADEPAAIDAVTRLRAALETAAAKHSGRVFNAAGDGFMLEFASAVGALSAAEFLCQAVEGKRVRVGVHLGDVVVRDSGDLLGHGVNVAARLQQMALPGAVVASVDVQRAVRGKFAQRLYANGPVQLDKMDETIDVFTLGSMALPASRRASKRRAEPLLIVLPFDNFSTVADMGHFSDGVADEIILTLMRQSNLKVISRTSAFQFRGERKNAAASELGATHVLDGAVRCIGSQLRVSAYLSEAGSGVALWCERYDRELVNGFEVQDDIAAEVGVALKQEFARPERPAQPVPPAAWDLYLRARQMWLTLSDLEEQQAETLLTKCIALAPNFAPAWAALAEVRAFLLPRDRDICGEPMHSAAVEAAETALDIDANCPQAYIALSFLKPAFNSHEEKLRLVDEALRCSPNNPNMHVARAAWLYGVGRVKEALRTLDFAAKLDPLGGAVECVRASLIGAQGDLPRAADIITDAWSRWPDLPFTWYVAWTNLGAAGRLEDAEALSIPEIIPKRGVTDADVRVLKRFVALLRMSPEERRAACDARLDKLALTNGALPLTGCIFAAGNGCADKAFDLIDHALDNGRYLRADEHDGFGMARSQTTLQFFVNDGQTPFVNHPRFPRLAARVGLVQYWLDTQCWPDCAATVDYDFKRACEEAADLWPR